MSPDRFFEEPREQSIVKRTIVSKYFWAWAKAIIPSAKRYGKNIAYIDLFSGPGFYDDGTESTPLMVLKTALSDSDISNLLITKFNDKECENIERLRDAVLNIDGISGLNHPPEFFNVERGIDLIRLIKNTGDIPRLQFVDPFGYKGVTLDLVQAAIKDFGCDCILFFNYNRVNAGLDNPLVKDHIDALFGADRADRLRKRVLDMSSDERELTILEEFMNALKGLGGTFVLPFQFKNNAGNRTSHYIVFVSKHFRGYEIMRDIMDKKSSSHVQGVPSFDYIPADHKFATLSQFCLPIEELGESLLDIFAGRTMTMKEIYEVHSADKRYVERNYKDALRTLEREKKINVSPSSDARKKIKGEVTFAEHVKVTFPERGK